MQCDIRVVFLRGSFGLRRHSRELENSRTQYLTDEGVLLATHIDQSYSSFAIKFSRELLTCEPFSKNIPDRPPSLYEAITSPMSP